MTKLWQQKTASDNLSAQAEAFTVGDDYLLDQRLIPYDVQASKVHARGLHKIGLLNDAELNDLLQTLDEILSIWKGGNFEIRKNQEDGHTAIEAFLIEKLGAAGKKIHTGRSRNDQVLVAMRLYEKAEIGKLVEALNKTIQSFLGQAQKYADVPMPGYTHTQRAMLSSVGMWLASMAEMLLQDLESLKAAHRNVNRSPLGTAAGFGVNIDLPREWVADELGFDGLIAVALTAQNTRGKIDLQLVQALGAIGATLAHFANDLIWYSSREFGFFEVDVALCTGSSIMPQKQNLDTAELLRARYAALCGREQAIKLNTMKLTSGYHRDLQLIKKEVMAAFDEIHAMVKMGALLAMHLSPNRERLEQACTKELFAADEANELVKKGVPFRDAYHEVKASLNTLQVGELSERLKAKKHIGATGNLGIEKLEKQLQEFKL